jgi:hypothetical protein
MSGKRPGIGVEGGTRKEEVIGTGDLELRGSRETAERGRKRLGGLEPSIKKKFSEGRFEPHFQNVSGWRSKYEYELFVRREAVNGY